MFKMNRLVFTIITLLFTGMTAFAQVDDSFIDFEAPGVYIIGDIAVEGAVYSDESAILNVSGLRIDQEITLPGPEIPKAIKNLWKLRLFTDIQISRTKEIGNVAFLKIKVLERPRLSRYSYNGVKKTLHDDLNSEVQRFALRGAIVTESVKMNSKQALEGYFIEKGYLDANVDVLEYQDSLLNNSVRLVFDIQKKKRVRIKEMMISGNHNVPDKKIRRWMKDTKRKRSIFKSSKLVDETYKIDKNNVVTKYNNLGYRDARIKRDTVYRADGGLYMEVDINEGNKYHFRDITFKGNTIYTTEQLEEVLGIEPGDVYNEELLQTRLSFSPDGRDVSSLYLDNGYLFFQVDPVEKSISNDSLDLEIRLFEGPQATIDRVVVEGNDRTHEHVIRRELRTKPGQKFSRSDIIRSQREILALGYFNQENLGINTPVNAQRGTVDIEYVVEERPSDQLELSAGWGGRGRGIIGTLGVTFSNFSLRNLTNLKSWSPLPQGDGQRLSLRAQTNGRFFQSYNVSFTEPWLGGKKPNSFTVAAFHSRSTNGGDKNTDNFTRLAISGVSVGLGTRLKVPDDFFTSSSTLSFQSIGLINSNGFFIQDEARTLRNGKYFNFSLNQTLARNSIDNPIYPKSGANVSLSLQVTPPYSLFRSDNFWVVSPEKEASLVADENLDRLGRGLAALDENGEATFLRDQQDERKYRLVEYHKWRFNAQWYTKIVGNLVFKAQAKIGFLGSFGNKLSISPFERYELGGDGIANFNIEGKDIISMRGYDTNELTANLTGGAAIFDKFTMELRYPISLNPSATIYVLGFVEGGNAWDRFKDFNPFDLKRSAGAGLRVFLPMFGTLGFDYGFGFDKAISRGSKWSEYGQFNIILGFEPE